MAWLAVALGAAGCDSAAVRSVPGGDPRRGAAVMTTYGCGACHVVPGVAGADGAVGPPLSQFSRRVYIAGEVENTSDLLIKWIQTPQSIEPGTAMPNLGVTGRDARDIAAYLYTLR